MIEDGARAALAHLRAVDPVLAEVLADAGPYGLTPSGQHFHALVSSIVSQQISTRAAAAIMARVEALYGAGDAVTAAATLALDPLRLRGAGLSGVKVSYILDLAAHVHDGRLDLARIALMDDDAVIDALVAVKGIGRWTAEMFLLFSLGRPDVLPVGDLGLRAAVQRHYKLDALPDATTLHAIGAAWSPYRGVATWYLWQSLKTARGEKEV